MTTAPARRSRTLPREQAGGKHWTTVTPRHRVHGVLRGRGWHSETTITPLEVKKCASDSDMSEGVGLDSVTEHQFSVAIAPPVDFTKVPTVSGDRPRGLQSWRTIVGVAGQPEGRPLGYRYDSPACFGVCSLPTPRALNEPIVPREYAHPVRCGSERAWAYLDGHLT